MCLLLDCFAALQRALATLELAARQRVQPSARLPLQAARQREKLLHLGYGPLPKAVRVEDTAPFSPEQKKVHFIRHGEGTHNVAQREWHEAGKPGEPYTIDNDPEFLYLDAKLTTRGLRQAKTLQRRTRLISPEIMIVRSVRASLSNVLAS